MDTRVLSARLYSGSKSPGGGPYRYTAPIAPAQARTLVAAFNGGFQLKDARGGYYTEGRMVAPLRPGAASLVISADGSVTVGAWGRDVTMTRNVVSVRQNLMPLVAGLDRLRQLRPRGGARPPRPTAASCWRRPRRARGRSSSPGGPVTSSPCRPGPADRPGQHTELSWSG
jgi:hypothetical protein